MTRRRLIRIMIPLVIALVATFAVAKLTARKTAPTESVVVAAVGVKPGTVLTAKDVQMQTVPAKAVLPGSLTSAASVEGQVALVGLTPGDPVLSDELQSSQTAGLSYQIPAGMRAFAVAVNGVSGVAGNLSPGVYVDVLATFPAQTKTNSGVSTSAHASVVVQDVAILALSAGGASSAPGSAGNGSPYTLATLAVTPKEAAIISLSEQLGSVTFLLRPHTGAGSGSASISAGGLP